MVVPMVAIRSVDMGGWRRGGNCGRMFVTVPMAACTVGAAFGLEGFFGLDDR